MSFVSPAFPIFVMSLFVLYYGLSSVRAQNAIIVSASYLFYGWWDWRFAPLLAGVSAANYIAAILIVSTTDRARQRFYLVTAVAISLLSLAVFKYLGFFLSSAEWYVKALGLQPHIPTLQIILPLGISFMTFQGIAYVVDVWRHEHAAERDLVRFLAFKAFFPQLIAGPIERAGNLLDQFARPRSLDAEKVARATWLLIHGYALKVLVADSMAPIVDALFAPSQAFAWSVILGTLAFGVQIYADFCGYSLIAKGVALLFGFDLVWNFRFPYWALSMSDFWRRWHISLSNWLRDYLYVPLGGNRGGRLATTRNLLITMTLGGLWHGASWNFVFWGLLHGAALTLWRVLRAPAIPQSGVGRAFGWLATMVVVFVGWFLFRATSWEVLVAMTRALRNWEWVPVHGALIRAILATLLPLALLEWLLRRHGDFFPLAAPRWVVYPAFSALLIAVVTLAARQQVSFIYFQF
jgi:alginate O-acetyltransferase complex protein AlgI